MSDTNTQQQGNRRRNRRPGGNNKSGGYSGGRTSTPRGGVPQQTGFQKFLSAVTFGLLGKPATLPQAQRSAPPAASERGPRPPRDRDSSSRPPREPREPRGPRRENTPVDPATIDTDRLYIGNLSYDASESDLFELFNGVGGVRNAEVVVNNRTQRSKGFAFVT
ncbi:MAG: RNA-binding protein, partial [Verrucomicrobia bacterium]|nr:RNA-binding protein [Verrucomicrobiota bacterium]